MTRDKIRQDKTRDEKIRERRRKETRRKVLGRTQKSEERIQNCYKIGKRQE